MKQFLLVMLAGFLATVAHADFKTGSQTAAIFGGIGGSGSQYSYQPGTDRPVTGGGGALGGQVRDYVKGWLAGLDTDDNAAIKNAGFTVRDKNGITQGNILFRVGVKI